eukprot:m.364745 g.364745  ORF g.364745 m.364745 type:complete len:106 (+) comp56042_c0_seq24:318-635(+)
MFELFLVISCLQPDFPEHASEVKLSDLFFLSAFLKLGLAVSCLLACMELFASRGLQARANTWKMQLSAACSVAVAVFATANLHYFASPGEVLLVPAAGLLVLGLW